MSLDAIPRGSEVLVDANIVVYHASDVSEECSRFLVRAERGELRLSMAAASYAEMLHRLMIAEARSRGLIVGNSPARRLRESPDVVRGLNRYLDVTAALTGCGLRLLDLDEEILRLSHPIRERYGLLVNDSLLVATSMARDIPVLASADKDFARVDELELYSPTDVVIHSQDQGVLG
ncbi:MAG: hypothetical protein AMXMBFR33_73740 [Candidatus Xenobia bacterium]